MSQPSESCKFYINRLHRNCKNILLRGTLHQHKEYIHVVSHIWCSGENSNTKPHQTTICGYTSSENHKIKFVKLEYLLQESYLDVKWDSCLKILTPNLKHRSIPQTQLYLHTLITYKSCYIQTTTPLEISIFSIAQNTTRNRKQNTFRRQFNSYSKHAQNGQEKMRLEKHS